MIQKLRSKHRYAFGLAMLACATAAGAGQPTMPRPANNPGDWVTTGDYPVEALRNTYQGIAGFTLLIDGQGNVRSCTITSSSGHAVLDVQTCELVKARARFFPGTDAKGRPVEGTYSNRVRWAVPGGHDQPRRVDKQYSFIVEKNGSITGCQLIKGEGLSDLEKDQVRALCSGFEGTAPFRDEQGNAVRRRVTIVNTVRIEPVTD